MRRIHRADIHWGHIGPRFGFAYQLNDKTVVQGGFSIAFLNGGAYEYGTSKVAVNYGNLLDGSFARIAPERYHFFLWKLGYHAAPQSSPTPFSPDSGLGTQIDAFSENDGYAPYSQQWNVNVQRGCRTTCSLPRPGWAIARSICRAN